MSEMHVRRMMILAVTTVALLIGAPLSARADFLGSIWLPGTHPLAKLGYSDWAEDVRSRSGGRLTPTLSFGGKTLSGPAHLAAIRDGVVQVGQHAATFTPKDLPEDNVLSLLAAGHEDPLAAALAFTDFAFNNAAMQARYRQNGVVFGGGFASPPYILACKKPVRTPLDFKDLRIGAPGWLQAGWFKSVGAVAVGMPISEFRAAIRTDLVDCIAVNGYQYGQERLATVTKYHITVPLGTATTVRACPANAK